MKSARHRKTTTAWLHFCVESNLKTKKTPNLKKQSRKVVTGNRGQGSGDRERLGKGYRCSARGGARSEDLTYGMVTVVDNKFQLYDLVKRRQSKRSLSHTQRSRCEVMDVLIN